MLSTRAIALIKFGSILNIVPASLEQELLAKDIFCNKYTKREDG
ncbi:hypothetical protein SSJG_02213 [Escherichia coli D9]|nr:hypothetical protein SSJG_02213 [Escherichia coli D9]